jgi:hypothetical protein
MAEASGIPYTEDEMTEQRTSPLKPEKMLARANTTAASLFDDLVELVAERACSLVLQTLQDAQEAANEPGSPWLSCVEAADLLRCKRQRIDDLLSAGRLTRFKEGGRTLVARVEVEALVTAERVAQVLPIASANRTGKRLAA